MESFFLACSRLLAHLICLLYKTVKIFIGENIKALKNLKIYFKDYYNTIIFEQQILRVLGIFLQNFRL